MANPRAKSIRLKCLDCSSGSQNEVRNCDYKNCQLYPYRMNRAGLPEGKTAYDRSMAIRHYCRLFCCNDQAKEVKLCPSVNCALWPHRGYRQKSDQVHTGDS